VHGVHPASHPGPGQFRHEDSISKEGRFTFAEITVDNRNKIYTIYPIDLSGASDNEAGYGILHGSAPFLWSKS